MKFSFTKITLSLLIVSVLSMLSGFCIFQPKLNSLMGINIAQAAVADYNSSDTSNSGNSCDKTQPTEKTQSSLSMSSGHVQNSLLPCCTSSGHSITASTIKSIDSDLSVPVAFLPIQHQVFISSPQTFPIHNPIFPLTALVSTKITVLRL